MVQQALNHEALLNGLKDLVPISWHSYYGFSMNIIIIHPSSVLSFRSILTILWLHAKLTLKVCAHELCRLIAW